MSSENFLDCRFPIFSTRVSDAAANGTLMNAGPLLNNLDRTYAVVRGLEQIFVIARANMVQESISSSSGENEAAEPPLNPVTVEVLMAMGAAVSGMLVRDIENLSDWAEKHAVQPAPPNPAA
jgi:hypothetical protein